MDRLLAPVDRRFHDFEKHGRFKDRYTHRTQGCMIRIFQARPMARYTGGREIYFRRVDEAFTDVRRIRA